MLVMTGKLCNSHRQEIVEFYLLQSSTHKTIVIISILKMFVPKSDFVAVHMPLLVQLFVQFLFFFLAPQ